MSQDKDKSAEEKRLAILGAIKVFDLPPLEEGTAAYASLEASILQHGCMSPIVMHGDQVLSGRARMAICDKNGIKYKVIQLDDLSEADLVSLQNDLSFAGRQIDNPTKKTYAKELLLATKGKLSNRAIGSKAGLDPKTVQVVREALETGEEIPHTVKRCDRYGRAQDVSDKDERKVKPSDDDVAEDKEQSEEDDEETNLHLVKVDSFDMPDTRPDYVYEVRKDKGSIVRRKVERQRGDKYYLSNGESIAKRCGHPTWLGAQEALVSALQTEKDDKEEEMEDLIDTKKKLVLDLKNIEAQIVGATKEIQKLDQRIEKVEQLVPPKGAAAETEEEDAA
jgi:hypothetical protein